MRAVTAHASPVRSSARHLRSVGRCPAAEMRYLGVSLGHATHEEAGRWLRDLGLPAGAEAYTHDVNTPYPHVAVSLAIPAGTALTLPACPAELCAAAAHAAHAAQAHAAQRSDLGVP